MDIADLNLVNGAVVDVFWLRCIVCALESVVDWCVFFGPAENEDEFCVDASPMVALGEV